MKGSVIVFDTHNEMTILEDVEKVIFDQIQEQIGKNRCVVTINNHNVDLGHVVAPVYWREGPVHME